MFQTPVTMLGLAGVTLLAGVFIPVSFVSLDRSQSFLPQPLARALSVSTKGDRLGSVKGDRLAGAAGEATARPANVSTVEVIGVSQATVIVRGDDGEILYRSDPRNGVTVLAKNTGLPVVLVKDGAPPPMPRREDVDTRQEKEPESRNPVGCLGSVSPLAAGGAGRAPSLCLASMDRPLF